MNESGRSAADDAEAEERATDEGMPEHPADATAEAAARTDLMQGEEAVASPDPRQDGPLKLPDYQEDDGGYDLGGEA